MAAFLRATERAHRTPRLAAFIAFVIVVVLSAIGLPAEQTEAAEPCEAARTCSPSPSGGKVALLRGRRGSVVIGGGAPGDTGRFTSNPQPAARQVPSGSLVSGFQVPNSVREGLPVDPQVAASRTHVVVTARGPIAFFNKAGQMLTGPIADTDFFRNLNVDSGANGTDDIVAYNDTRVIFDEYRKRFWITALGYNQVKNSLAGGATIRNILAIAVSKTENPLDGFWLYRTDAVTDQGSTTSTVYLPGDDADYPSIAVDPVGVHITNLVANTVTPHFYIRVAVFPASALASGTTTNGWQYWDLRQPDGRRVDFVQPVMHHGSTGGAAYYVNRWDDGANDAMLVLKLSNPLSPSQALTSFRVNIFPAWTLPTNGPQANSSRPIKFDNLQNWPIDATYRNGELWATTQDSRPCCGPGTQTTTIARIIRITGVAGSSPTTFSYFVDSQNTSTPTWTGWHGVELNRFMNAAVVYARTSSIIFPQVRFLTMTATPLGYQLSPGQVLRFGDGPYAGAVAGITIPLAWGDTAGTSVDPYDDEAIWISQQFATICGSPPTAAICGDNTTQFIGKIFGAVHPDLIVDGPVTPASSVLTLGSTVRVYVPVRNQGDGPSGTAEGVVTLRDQLTGVQMSTYFPINSPTLASGGSGTQIVELANVPTGNYNIAVSLDWNHAVAEYSDSNNFGTGTQTVIVVGCRGC